MTRILLFALLALLEFGCTMGAMDALILSDDDVEQSLKLIEARDGKACFHTDGAGSFASVQGKVEIYGAIGKNLSYDTCWQSFNPGRELLSQD